MIHRTPRRATQLVIDIHFHPPTHTEADETEPVTQLIHRLTTLRFESEFTYDIFFTLGKKASQRIFPLKLPLLAGTIVDEFRGFRGVKHEGERIAYQLSIESPELKELYVDIKMSRREVFHYDLLHQIVREAAGILEELVPASEWSE